jgi:hypothetical protein
MPEASVRGLGNASAGERWLLGRLRNLLQLCFAAQRGCRNGHISFGDVGSRRAGRQWRWAGMTDHPRFQEVKDPPDVAYRAYHGGRLVELVFWLADRWKVTRAARQAARSPDTTDGATEADKRLPMRAPMAPHPTALQPAASRQTANAAPT